MADWRPGRIAWERLIGYEDNIKEVCETFAPGKQSSKFVPKETKNKAQKPLEPVYSDILGPLEVPMRLHMLMNTVNDRL